MFLRALAVAVVVGGVRVVRESLSRIANEGRSMPNELSDLKLHCHTLGITIAPVAATFAAPIAP